MAKSRKKSSGKSSKSFFPFKTLVSVILSFLFLTGIGISFLPEDCVPESLEPLHSACLRVRNTAIAKTGLNWSRYQDTEVVPVYGGAAPIKLFFAPSPKITPALCELINSAKSSVDMCIYDLDLNAVSKALVNASNRKVHVNVVTDEDNFELAAVDRLKKAGIRVVPDKRPAIMHNKFVVVDARYLWTGSFNFTVNGEKKNDNNALILDSPGIAAAYSEKFAEYLEGKFGPKASNLTVNGRTMLGDSAVEAAFSPSDGVLRKILNHLKFAKKSVYMMAFSFTSKPISEELAELSKKGVSVKCLLDRGQAGSSYRQDSYLRGCGIDIKLSPNTTGKMHHKVIVIDDETVITGSYNFSNNAEKYNDENVLIIKNAALAAAYRKEFKRCWKGTKGY